MMMTMIISILAGECNLMDRSYQFTFKKLDHEVLLNAGTPLASSLADIVNVGS